MEKQPHNQLKIQQAFIRNDTLKEGKLTAQQVLNALKEDLDFSSYKGSVSKIIRLLNYENQEQKTINMQQFAQYYKVVQDKAKYNIWKSKYQLLEKIHQIRKKTNAAPSQMTDKGQTGDIKVTIGAQKAQYPSNLELSLTKQKKNEAQPFIKLLIEGSSHEQAKKIEVLINTVYSFFAQLIKSQEPDIANEVDTIKLTTNVNNKIVLILITTSNSELMDLGRVVSKFIDESINRSVQAMFNIKFGFHFDFFKFMNEQSYTFYGLFTRDCSLKIKWNSSNFLSSVKQTLLMNDFFSDLIHEPTNPLLLGVIGGLSMENCEADIEFNNTQLQNAQIQSKQGLMDTLMQIKEAIMSIQKNNEILELLQLIKGKITAEARLGDWKVEIIINIKDITKIITECKTQEQQNMDYNDDD